MARATKLSAAGGKLKSARAKIGGACSTAMSAWKTSGMTPAIAAVLGKCRSQARMRNQASNARLGGNEARAQTLEKRADRGLTQKERLARAKELVAKRKAGMQAQPAAAPALREQVATHRRTKGTLGQRRAAVEGRLAQRAARQREASNFGYQSQLEAARQRLSGTTLDRSIVPMRKPRPIIPLDRPERPDQRPKLLTPATHWRDSEGGENLPRRGPKTSKTYVRLGPVGNGGLPTTPIPARMAARTQPAPAPKFFRPAGQAGTLGGKVKVDQRPKVAASSMRPNAKQAARDRVLQGIRGRIDANVKRFGRPAGRWLSQAPVPANPESAATGRRTWERTALANAIRGHRSEIQFLTSDVDGNRKPWGEYKRTALRYLQDARRQSGGSEAHGESLDILTQFFRRRRAAR